MPEVTIIHYFTPMARHTHLLGYPPSDGAVGDCLTECEDDEWAEDMYASDMSFSHTSFSLCIVQEDRECHYH